jgi:N-acetylglucosaminyl-diphospho-decaprenol L-rhamnosyltransferase
LELPPLNVSVVVVNYNCYKTLYDCISSILRSKWVGELLLVDNASTDKSLALIEKFTDDVRLKIIRLDRNIGLARAQNLAAAKTRSNYLAFADADSRVDPEWLEVPCLLLENNKEIGAVQCNVICSKHSDKIATASANVLSDGCRWMKISKGKHICYWRWLFPIGAGFVVRRDAWDLVKGFDPEFFVCNDDVDFGIRLWVSGYEVVISSEGTVYHEGGTLRSRKDIAPIFLFYEVKSTLTVWAKDLENKTLIKQVLPFSLLYPFMAFWRGGVMGVKGLFSFLGNLPSIIHRRYKIQQMRKISDNKIIPLMRGAGTMPVQLLIHDFQLFSKKIFRKTKQ